MQKITLIRPGNALQPLELLSSSFAMGRMPMVLKISRTLKSGKRTKQSMNLLIKSAGAPSKSSSVESVL